MKKKRETTQDWTHKNWLSVHCVILQKNKNKLQVPLKESYGDFGASAELTSKPCWAATCCHKNKSNLLLSAGPSPNQHARSSCIAVIRLGAPLGEVEGDRWLRPWQFGGCFVWTEVKRVCRCLNWKKKKETSPLLFPSSPPGYLVFSFPKPPSVWYPWWRDGSHWCFVFIMEGKKWLCLICRYLETGGEQDFHCNTMQKDLWLNELYIRFDRAIHTISRMMSLSID